MTAITPMKVWNGMPVDVRFRNIKGLHPLAYGAEWNELTDKEKNLVRQFVNTMKE